MKVAMKPAITLIRTQSVRIDSECEKRGVGAILSILISFAWCRVVNGIDQRMMFRSSHDTYLWMHPEVCIMRRSEHHPLVDTIDDATPRKGDQDGQDRANTPLFAFGIDPHGLGADQRDRGLHRHLHDDGDGHRWLPLCERGR